MLASPVGHWSDRPANMAEAVTLAADYGKAGDRRLCKIQQTQKIRRTLPDNAASRRFCIARPRAYPANRRLAPPDTGGTRHAYYPLPLRGGDVGGLLEVQARAVGLAVGHDL